MISRPRILITNDDGIHAPGIKHLWHALQDIADLTIIAPAAEQSAVSLSITTRHPLRIEQVQWAEEVKVWSITGTPADCIKMGVSVILKEKPNLIVSGVNRGTNAGRNVLYSGTVAGVIEGVMHGIPGIAFSCHDYVTPNYAVTEKYIVALVRYILDQPLPEGSFLNVNFPAKITNRINGIKITKQGKEFWAENPDERIHPAEGHSYYWLGAKLLKFPEEDDCDITWLSKGYIAAVPIKIAELTDDHQLERRRDSFEKQIETLIAVEESIK